MNKSHFKGIQGTLFENYPLARHTSWRVGGMAELCYLPQGLKDLEKFVAKIPDKVPITWLGLGSNVLIRDAGIKGVVILTLNRLNQLKMLEGIRVYAEAGVTCAKLAKFCVRHGFEQGAFFAGIPGTVGGALAMNAGAFKEETWKHVVAVDVMTRRGEVIKRQPHEFDVRYREVNHIANEYFVAGYFQFKVGNSFLAQEKLRQLIKNRNDSQPIGKYSCGSVFRNPLGDYAARLIEKTGLKGHRMGEAMVSEKHANFILNTGHASAKEIESLIHFIQAQVYLHQGVALTPEVHVLGEA